MEQASTVHPFERAGLGKAPFKFVSLEHRTFQATPDAPVQPGGSCDYCGTGISFFCWIDSSDGRHFKVGSDCVRKTDPALYAEHKAAERAERRASRDRDLAEEEAKLRTNKLARAEAFIDLHAGLRQAFEAGASAKHAILADIHAKLIRFGSLTEKQIAFAIRLGDEIRNPKPAEVHVPAPTGRVTVEGEVIQIREVEDHYSFSRDAVAYKMIVKIATPDGTWLCWSTVPLALGSPHDLKGKRVVFTATLHTGNDAHFAFAKRPTKAAVIEQEATNA